MNLDQFKASLDSDARKRCAAQEKTIREYRAMIKEKDEQVGVLANRCFSLTVGGMCSFCKIKDECPALQQHRGTKPLSKNEPSSHKLVWQEFSPDGKMITKTKRFRSPEAMTAYTNRLFAKENFWQIVATD